MDPSGHEHHAMAIEASQVRQVLTDFFGIQNRSYHKLELILTFGHQRLDDLGCIAYRIVFANPGLGGVPNRAGIAQLGADRPQIASYIAVDRAGRLDRDVFATLLEFFAQFRKIVEDHRFAAGEHHMLDPKRFDLMHDFLDAVARAFGFPGCIAGVAVPAAQVAAARADEDARSPSEKTFTLDALKYLGNPDQSKTL